MAAGLIVAEYTTNPEQEKPDWTPEEYPPLRKWSDVVSILWIDATRGNAQNLKHIIRSIITNGETLSVMRRAVGEGEFDEDFKNWGKFEPIDTNGRTFRPGDEAFYALLYTPNGRGIGWFLFSIRRSWGSRQ